MEGVSTDMSIKQCVVCDGCNCKIDKSYEIPNGYRFNMTGDILGFSKNGIDLCLGCLNVIQKLQLESTLFENSSKENCLCCC